MSDESNERNLQSSIAGALLTVEPLMRIVQLDKVIKATGAPSCEATVGTSIHLVIVDVDLGKATLEIDLQERKIGRAHV